MAWSTALFRLLGYDPQRDQANVESFFAAVHPDDRERVRSTSAHGAATGDSQAVEFRLLRGDGSVREVVMDGVATRDPAGQLTGFTGVVLDVTEPRRVELELRRRTSSLDEAQRIAHVGSWTFDPASGRLSWSAELYRLLGIEPSIEPTAELFSSLIHPEDRARVDEVAARVLSCGVPEPHEYRVVRRDGTVRHLATQARAIIEVDGRVSFVGVTADVSERKELEARLLQAQKMEALGRLAGGIAHDFNNLLTIVQGFVSLLRSRDPSEELDHIAAAAEAGARLTRQLLLFSRQAVVEPRSLDLNAVVRDSVRLIGRTLGEDIEIRLELAPELWPVRADPGQVQQILVNLAVNARDAMPQGGVLSIRTANRHPGLDDAGGVGADAVELEVVDNGVGMDDPTRQRIFEPFFTTKPRGRGTGLGLATVFGIVTGAGGQIEVVTAPGRGARFLITLPRDREVASSPLRNSSLATAVLGASPTVLVVEDEPAIATLMARFLESRGIEVLRATHPSVALELWDEHADQVALVVCDLVLPGIPGRELVGLLRRRRPGLPVLFVSGYSDDFADLSLDLGPAAGFLAKPFELAELEARIAELLEAAG